jgi:hypothetical protein
MIENIQDPQEGGGIQEEIAAQTQEVEQKQINEQQETQEQVEQQQEQTQEQQQQEQEQIEQVEPVPVSFRHFMKYLPPAFQIIMPNGWFMKVVVNTKRAKNCYTYKSRSGLTFKGCYHYYDGLNLTRGLYIVEPPELVISSRAKLTRDWEHLDKLLLETIKLYSIEEGKLITFGNWGFSIYDNFRKAPTLQFQQIMRQGHLYVYKVPAPAPWDAEDNEFKEDNHISIYNHDITFSKNVRGTQLVDEGTGVVYLVYIPELVAVKSTSPDHPEENTSLSKGWYLFVHQRPADDNAD